MWEDKVVADRPTTTGDTQPTPTRIHTTGINSHIITMDTNRYPLMAGSDNQIITLPCTAGVLCTHRGQHLIKEEAILLHTEPMIDLL